jgi:hypothetical protein
MLKKSPRNCGKTRYVKWNTVAQRDVPVHEAKLRAGFLGTSVAPWPAKAWRPMRPVLADGLKIRQQLVVGGEERLSLWFRYE